MIIRQWQRETRGDTAPNSGWKEFRTKRQTRGSRNLNGAKLGRVLYTKIILFKSSEKGVHIIYICCRVVCFRCYLFFTVSTKYLESFTSILQFICSKKSFKFFFVLIFCICYPLIGSPQDQPS